MSDLDQPLRDVLSGHSSAIDCGQYDEAIADIKQALKEAGYKKPNTPFEDIMEAREIMQNEDIPTGPRAEFSIGMPSSVWLTRFKIELDTDKHLMTPGAYKHALEIAKRAANL